MESQDFESKTYSMDTFQSLKADLVRELDNKDFREIKAAYDMINGLQYKANLGEISIREYREALEAIKRVKNLLK